MEKMYAALPALLYVNASLVGPLLRPLLDAQDNLTTPYAAPDIGQFLMSSAMYMLPNSMTPAGPAYPNATGVNLSQADQGVERTSCLLRQYSPEC